MLEFMNTLAAEGVQVVRQVGLVVAVLSVVITWALTRQLIPVLATVLLSAIALYAISPDGLGWLEQRIEEDAAKAGSASSMAPAGFAPAVADLTTPVVVEVDDATAGGARRGV